MKKIGYFVKNKIEIKNILAKNSDYLFVLGVADPLEVELWPGQIRFTTEKNIERTAIIDFFDEIYIESGLELNVASFLKNKSNLYRLGA